MNQAFGQVLTDFNKDYLTPGEFRLYKTIAKYLLSCNPIVDKDIRFPLPDFLFDELSNVRLSLLNAILLDYPSLVEVINLKLCKGVMIASTVKLCENDLKKTDEICDFLKLETFGKNDYQKTKIIHNYLVSHSFGMRIDEIGNDNKKVHSMVGCLVDGKCVCDGAAKAFSYLCGECGVKCGCIQVQFEVRNKGKSTGFINHALNIVEIEGIHYLVDVSQDMMQKSVSYRRGKSFIYPCWDHAFLMSYEEAVVRGYIFENCICDKLKELCPSNSRNPLEKEGFVFTNHFQMREKLAKMIETKQYFCVEFKGKRAKSLQNDFDDILHDVGFVDFDVWNAYDGLISCVCGGKINEQK